MASPAEAPGFDDTADPCIARINDFWLEGEHNGPADREYARRIELCAPYLPYLVRASRALLGRMMRQLLDKGVRQFLDLGSGIPTRGHVHEVVLAAEPDSRVVYVDNDPGVAADSLRVLEGVDNVAYLEADFRDREAVLGDPTVRAMIDFSQPVALLVIETLLHLSDDADAAGLIESYVDALPAGSYLGMTHCGRNPELDAGLDMFSRMFGTPPMVTLREKDQLEEFFGDLEIVTPGVVPVPFWKPESSEDLGREPESAFIYAGLGRKG